MKIPKVSIAMATYNGGRFLRKQLDSLYSQNYPPFEVVVCDDNSNDDTHVILEDYRQKKGLHYYVNEQNLGPTRNFYRALSLCNGDYVMICDQDDIWLPNKIEETLHHMLDIDDGHPCLVSSLSQQIDAKDSFIGKPQPDKPDTYGYQYIFIEDDSAQGCSLMLNRHLIRLVFDFINNYKQASDIMYDYFIGMVASLYGHKYNCGKRLMLYRHHDKNVVAKATGHRSFISKMKEANTLVHFQTNGIFEACIIGDIIFDRGDELKEAKELLHKLALIGQSSSLVEQLRILFSISEIDFSRKIKIAFDSISVRSIKLFIK